MKDYNEIGARLRELREVSDYTVEQLAAELNLNPEVYASYEENGKTDRGVVDRSTTPLSVYKL